MFILQLFKFFIQFESLIDFKVKNRNENEFCRIVKRFDLYYFFQIIIVMLFLLYFCYVGVICCLLVVENFLIGIFKVLVKKNGFVLFFYFLF